MNYLDIESILTERQKQDLVILASGILMGLSTATFGLPAERHPVKRQYDAAAKRRWRDIVDALARRTPRIQDGKPTPDMSQDGSGLVRRQNSRKGLVVPLTDREVTGERLVRGEIWKKLLTS